MPITTNYKQAVIDLVESFDNEDKLQFGEAIIEEIPVDNPVNEVKEVLTGVKDGDLVPILKNNDDYTMFPVADEKVCGTESCDMPINFSAVKWDLSLMKCKIPICLNAFEREFLRFFNTQRKFDNNPDLDQLLLQYLGKQFKQGLENAKWRRAYFADPASTSALLEGSSGFFIKADAGTIVGETKVNIAKNGGATFVQQRMTGEEVYNLLQEMYDLASLQTWFDPSKFIFEVTWEMANAYSSWLNKLGHKAPANCQCYDAEGITKAVAYSVHNIAFNNIPVIPRIAFSKVIAQVGELNGNGVAGAARVDPNRALLVENDNMLIGTSEESQLTFQDIWYNKDDEKIYMRGGAYMGAAFPEIDKIIYAN